MSPSARPGPAVAIGALVGSLSFALASAVSAGNTWTAYSSAAFCGVATSAAFLGEPALASISPNIRRSIAITVPLLLCLADLLITAAILRGPGAELWLVALPPMAWVGGWKVAPQLTPYVRGARSVPPPPLRGLILAFAGGVVLLFASVGTARSTSTAGGVSLALLLYLLTGLILAARLHLDALRRLWGEQHAVVRAGASSRWGQSFGGSAVAAAAAAALIPLGLVVASIAIVLSLLARADALLSQIKFGVYHGHPLFNRHLHTNKPFRRFVGPNRPHAHPPLNLPGLVIALLVVLVVAYAAVAYYRHHRDGIPLADAFLQPLCVVWSRLVSLLRRIRTRVVARVPDPLSGLLPGAPSISRPWNRLNLHRLPPREQVLAYYAATAAYARHRHRGRAVSDTPLEYGGRLAPALEEASFHLDQLTDLFDSARYSAAETSSSDADRARLAWVGLHRRLAQLPTPGEAARRD